MNPRPSLPLVLMTAASLFAAACGDDGGGPQTVALVDLLPASGEVTGWEEDTSQGESGPEVTETVAGATAWVNGAIDHFVADDGWVGLAQEFYKKGALEIELHIYERRDMGDSRVDHHRVETTEPVDDPFKTFVDRRLVSDIQSDRYDPLGAEPACAFVNKRV